MIRFVIVCMLLVLTSCSTIQEIQYQAYAVGLGMDYADGKYHVVLQFLDFSNVAKTEQGKSEQSNPIWLAKGSGKSPEDALAQVYEGIQIPVNFDHLNIFLFGKALLRNRLEQTLQALDSNFNIRQTGMVYGTEERLDKIFTTKVPFYYAFSAARISMPNYMQQQDSTIPAITLQDLLYQYHEKTKTVVLPNVAIKNSIVRKDLEPVPVTVFQGAYLIRDKQLRGLLSNQDLQGYIRVNNKAIRTYLSLEKYVKKHQAPTVVEIIEPNIRRVVGQRGNRLVFGLDVKVVGITRETSQNTTGAKIRKRVEDEIQNEVYSSYQKARNIGIDLYQFEDYVYRFRYRDWQRYMKGGRAPSLAKQDIKVKVLPLKSIEKINPSRK